MHKITRATLLASLALGLTAPIASTASAGEASEAQAEHYSVAETPAGKLIDDPRSAAVLQKLIPTVWKNDMFQSMGRDFPLKAIQQYEAVLTDEKLAEIQAELDKIPVKE